MLTTAGKAVRGLDAGEQELLVTLEVRLMIWFSGTTGARFSVGATRRS